MNPAYPTPEELADAPWFKATAGRSGLIRQQSGVLAPTWDPA